MKSNKARRVFAALFLLLSLSVVVTPVLAANDNYGGWHNSKLEQLDHEIMAWYKLSLAIVIPLFIVRFASCGLSILGTLFMNKGEFQLDKIYKNIMYTVIALIIIIVLPSIIDEAIEYFAIRRWKPPEIITYHPIFTPGGTIKW